MKKVFIIMFIVICAICVIAVLCVWLSPIKIYLIRDKGALKLQVYKVSLVAHENNVKLKFYMDLSSRHGANSDLRLFYKSKLICSEIGGNDPNRFLLSPDLNLILYIHEDFEEGEKYGIYNIKEDKIIESSGEGYLVGLHQKVKWLGDKVILSDDEQKDTLDLKTGTVEIVMAGNKTKTLP